MAGYQFAPTGHADVAQAPLYPARPGYTVRAINYLLGLPEAARPRLSRKVAADLVGVGDMIIILVALIVPCTLLASFSDWFPRRLELLRSGLLACLISYGCFQYWQLYDTSSMRAFPVRAGRIMLSVLIAMLVVIGISIPVGVPTATMFLTWPLVWFSAASGLLILFRLAAREFLASLAAAQYFTERVAVYGAGEIAERVQEYVTAPGNGVRFAGTYDDRTAGRSERASLADEGAAGLLPTGGLVDLIEAGRDGRVDRIIVALPQSADRRLGEIARELDQLPVTVHAVTHFSSDLFGVGRGHRVTNMGPVGLITVKERPLSDWAPILKRVEDVLISVTLLVVALPVLLIIAVAVKLTSAGPVLFRQRRHGLNQKVIEVLKFRSMTVQENGSEVRQATRNDQRVTFVGRILRRSSLDELPQLANVLIGDMSLVGPRPHALVHDQQWSELLEEYANRHQVKPGITGLAQVRGLRGEAHAPGDIQKRIDADLEYIANWSLWLDVSIIFRTVWAVIGARNAH